MHKTRIRALILDYGGVIGQSQNSENVDNILLRIKQKRSGFYEVYRSQRARYDIGQISGEQYWANVLQDCGLTPSDFDIAYLIQEDVRSWTHINDLMIRFVTEIRSRISKLAIVSDMPRDTLAYIRGHYEWLELFDELCFSCEIGENKPGRGIYENCLKRLGMSPGECLFVDDSVENVHGAMALGMFAIQFKSYSEFVLELNERFNLA